MQDALIEADADPFADAARAAVPHLRRWRGDPEIGENVTSALEILDPAGG